MANFRKKLVGYDLDGVLCPDIDLTRNTLNGCSLSQVIQARRALAPMFYPAGPFVVITGRPVADRELTVEWMSNYFSADQYKLIHNTGGSLDRSESAAFKVNHILELGVTLFVESDADIAQRIRTRLEFTRFNVKIVTMQDLVTRGLRSYSSLFSYI